MLFLEKLIVFVVLLICLVGYAIYYENERVRMDAFQVCLQPYLDRNPGVPSVKVSNDFYGEDGVLKSFTFENSCSVLIIKWKDNSCEVGEVSVECNR